MTLSISPGRDHFLRDGKPFFYLADTVWAAFTNASLEEWRGYVRRRREQGFTALQISLLPIVHDRSDSPGEVMPFERGDGGFDFARPHHFIRMRTLPLRDAGDTGVRTAHRGFPVGGLFYIEFVVDSGRYEA